MMKISIQCSNGHKLSVPAKLSGKRGKCPACGVEVQIPIIPQATETEPRIQQVSNRSQPVPKAPSKVQPVAPSPQPAYAKLQPSPAIAPRHSSPSPAVLKKFPWLLVAVGSFAAVAFIGITFGTVMYFFGGSNSSANKKVATIPSNSNQPVETSGNTKRELQQLLAGISLKNGEVEDALVLPSLGIDTATLKEPASVVPNENHRKIGFAIQNYFDRFRMAPNCTKANQQPSGLSWRVHILPFLDQKELHGKFALNEPWDSPTNQALIEFLPSIFKTEKSVGFSSPYRMAAYKSFKLGEMNPDQALLVAEFHDTSGDPWTKPDDLPDDPSFTLGQHTSEPTISILTWSMNTLEFPVALPNDVFQEIASGKLSKTIFDAGTLKRFLAHANGEHLVSQATSSRWEANQMKTIAFAWHNYESTFKCLPPRVWGQKDLARANAEINLSWRVHILPFIGHSALYERFKLNEPWDSEHNMKLIKFMPDVYRDARAAADSTTTRIVSFSGSGTLFETPHKPYSFRNLTDGSAATIAFMQAPEDFQVPWTKPEDFPVDNLNNLSMKNGLPIALVDGAIRTLQPSIDLLVLKALITPDGKELIKDSDWMSNP